MMIFVKLYILNINALMQSIEYVILQETFIIKVRRYLKWFFNNLKSDCNERVLNLEKYYLTSISLCLYCYLLYLSVT